MSQIEFKVGDKVKCAFYGDKIFTLTGHDPDGYLFIEYEDHSLSFYRDGRHSKFHTHSSLLLIDGEKPLVHLVTKEAAELFGLEEEEVAPVVDVVSERIKFEADQDLIIQQKELAALRVKGTSRAWTFELLDSALVPREFLIVNERFIRSAIKSGSRKIAGVRIFEETKISIRG